MDGALKQIFHVKPEEAGLRIDHFAKQKIAQYSRTFFQKLALNNNILLNGKPVKSSALVKDNDAVVIHLPLEAELVAPIASVRNQLSNYEVKIVHQDTDFMIISKPAGLLTHKRSGKNNEVTLVDWLVNYCQAIKNVGQGHRPGIVHRLDKDTSGIMIIPLTNQAHEKFTQMFIDRAIAKTYLAFVEGHPEKMGSIDFSIGRHPFLRVKMATNATKSRDALTHYRVLEYFEKHSLLELKPKTGRTHQIRVHCQAMGHPLVGDTVYGGNTVYLGRHALHASMVAFSYEGKEYCFEAELPEDFKALHQKFAQSNLLF